MRPDHRTIDTVNRPVQFTPAIGLLLEGRQNPIPDTRFLPAIEATGHGLLGAGALGQVPPGCPGLEDPQDATDDPPMVVVGSTNPGLLG